MNRTALFVFLSAAAFGQTIQPKPSEVGRVQIYDSYQIETPRIYQVPGFGQPTGYRAEIVGLRKGEVLIEENNRVVATTPVDLEAAGRIPTTADGPFGDDDHPFFESLTELIASHAIGINAPSIQIAVAHQGRLKYFRSFGWAGLRLQSNPVPVGSAGRYRIASVTKPITAWALIRYWEQNLRSSMTLEEFLADVRPLEELAQSPQFDPFLDSAVGSISTDDLLRHCGGFLGSNTFGPTNDANSGIFDHPWLHAQGAGLYPLSTQETHSVYRNISFYPFPLMQYSNTGYNYLARYLESQTGTRPDIWLRENLLRPLGIRHTERGNSRFEDRLDGEVSYNGTALSTNVLEENGAPVPSPYGSFHMESLHGSTNLIANAADLARFASIFEAGTPPPMFSQEIFDTAFRSFQELGYFTHMEAESGKYVTDLDKFPAGGWWVTSDSGSLMHNGSMPGTRAYVLHQRQSTGLSIAILCNERSVPYNGGTIDPIAGSDTSVVSLRDQVRSWLMSGLLRSDWPDALDLFEHHGYYSPEDQHLALSVREQDLPGIVFDQLNRRRFPMVVEGDDTGRQSVIFDTRFPNGAVSVVLARDFDYYLQQVQNANQRIVSLDSYIFEGEPHYNITVNAEAPSVDWHASANQTIGAFSQEWSQLDAQGYVISDISVVLDKGKRYYTTLYTRPFDKQSKLEVLPPNQVAARDAHYRSLGYHLSCIDGFVDNLGDDKLVCVWLAGQADRSTLALDLDATSFEDRHDDYTVGMTKIMRIVDLTCIDDGTSAGRFSGVWANED